MRYYELIYIVNSNVERKKIDQVMKDISSRLENTDSKIINHVIWGKKKLAYPIKGNTYGNYILLHCLALQHMTAHHITSHCFTFTLQYITLHYSTSQYITMHAYIDT